MQYFKPIARYLVAGLGLMLALPALAVGTAAGTSVTNSVTLDYQVIGVDQPQQVDTVAFVVDRKLAVQVQTQDADWISAPINQEFAGLSGVPALNYLLTNLSNAPVDVVLGVVSRGAVDIGGSFSPPIVQDTGVDGVLVAIDTNGNNVYDATDTVLSQAGGVFSLPTTLSSDPAVNSLPILVVADISASAADGDYEAFSLVAGVASAPGVAYGRDDNGEIAPGSGQAPVDQADDPTLEQNVFADFLASPDPINFGFDFFAGVSTGAPDAEFDGQSSDTSGYVVNGVDLQIAKYVEVIYDPVNQNKYAIDGVTLTGSQPKAIPGAVIMYVIGVANQDTVFDADNLAVADDVQVGPVLLGDNSAASDDVYYPASVAVDYPNATSETFALPAPNSGSPLDLDEVTIVDCAGTDLSGPYGADPAEVAANLGTCAADSSGYFVYFVTVDAG